MILGLIIFLVILFILIVYLMFYHQISLLCEKIIFKHKVAKKIYKIAKDNDYYLLNKVAINIEGKIIHFDHLLFANKYIYCIGVNYYSVAINGRLNDKKWFHYKSNNGFDYINNPMRIHRERVNYFSSLTGSSSDIFVSTIVINDSCLIEDNNYKYDKIINLKNLSRLVKDYENENVEVIDPSTLDKLVHDVYEKGIEK